MNIIKEEKITFNTFGFNEKANIETKLLEYLSYIDKEDYFDNLFYILNELIGNAEKANLKRVYFIKKGLDIHPEEEYSTGIVNFKNYVSLYLDEYVKLLVEDNFSVTVEFLINKEKFSFVISNNSPLLPVELAKVNEMKKNASRFNSIDEIFTSGIDPQEGDGLGIVIIMLMLRKIGLYDNNLKRTTDNVETKVEINIPLNLMNRKEAEIISEDVIKEIESIPQLPQVILELLNVLDDLQSNFENVSDKIKKRPGIDCRFN